MNPTTDPALRSFIEYDASNHFPIQNLPFGVFKHQGATRIGVRIGDFILDLTQLEKEGVLPTQPGLFCQSTLNDFFSQGNKVWSMLRAFLSRMLSSDNPQLRDSTLRDKVIIPVSVVTMQLPVTIGDYTDFYSSREHATNVGTMFRSKENALMENWLHLPVAYHGRASSIVISGTPVRRPVGQVKAEDADLPTLSPCRLLDFELEMGFFIGPGTELGQSVAIDTAKDHIFGMVLVNDWSARDIQKWEYQPLGPFNAKNFATSISPWVVSLEALEPFRCKGPHQHPPPLPYLIGNSNWSYDINLQVFLQDSLISSSNFKHMYWSMAQQLAHHTITGCNINAGDMMASGTISAPQKNGYGSLLELSWKGTKPLLLANGEKRTFLKNHDKVTMSGWAQGDGYRLGFGEVTGEILPSV